MDSVFQSDKGESAESQRLYNYEVENNSRRAGAAHHRADDDGARRR